MLSSIMSFLGGIGDFSSYITEYFKNSSIKKTQKNIDTLEEEIRVLKSKLSAAKVECEREKERLRAEMEQSVDALTVEIDAMHPKIGGRTIEG